MKDLTQWLVTRLQTAKQADAVVAGALPHAAIDAIEASRYIPFSQQNPLLAGIRKHYSAADGGRDLVRGTGRMLSEGARMALVGQGEAPSIAGNLLNHGSRALYGSMFTAPAKALGTFAGGISGGQGWRGAASAAANDYNAAADMATQPFRGGGFGEMFSQPFTRAMGNPEGIPRAGREVSGLLNRWQPKILMGDSINQRFTSTMPIPEIIGGGGMLPPFWKNYLGIGNRSWERPVTQSWQDQTKGITDLGKKLRPEVSRLSETY